MRFLKVVPLLGAALTLGATGLRAQTCNFTDPALNCTVNTTVSATVVTVARLTLNVITTNFGTLTEADFNTGYKDATGPAATVKANNTWTLTVKSSTGTWSGGAGTKPAADLTWDPLSEVSPDYSNVMSTSAATLNSGTATNGSTETILYRSLWTYALDGPGSYSLTVEFTLSAP